MKRLFVWGCAALFLSPAMGEVQPTTPPVRSVSVWGEGEVKEKPNEAVLNFNIETFGPVLKPVKDENAQRSKVLLDSLNALKIRPEDVQTTTIQINPRYQFEKGKRKFIEFHAMKGFTVLVRNLEDYGRIINAALDAGVEYTNGAQFRHSDMKNLEQRAIERAVLNAKAKAETAAKALGSKAGRPLSIEEEGTAIPVYQGMASRAMMKESLDGSGFEDTLSAGEITINAKVRAQFELQ